MRSGAVVRALGLALLVWAGAAAGVDSELLAGKRLVLHRGPKGESLLLVGRGALIAPLPGGSDDPTVTGATLDIGNPDTGEWARLDAPASGWSSNTLGTIFRFHDDAALGARDVQTLVIQHGRRLKVIAAAAGLSLAGPAEHAVAVVVTSGTRRYCMLFGGAVRRDEPGRFAARNAPAPAFCVAPSEATGPTSTSTSSTTTPRAPTTSSTNASQPTSTTTTSSSTSSTHGPGASTTVTTRPPKKTTSSSSSSSSSSTATFSSTSSTSSTVAACGGVAPLCGGTCPPGQSCTGRPLRACHCE